MNSYSKCTKSELGAIIEALQKRIAELENEVRQYERFIAVKHLRGEL